MARTESSFPVVRRWKSWAWKTNSLKKKVKTIQTTAKIPAETEIGTAAIGIVIAKAATTEVVVDVAAEAEVAVAVVVVAVAVVVVAAVVETVVAVAAVEVAVAALVAKTLIEV